MPMLWVWCSFLLWQELGIQMPLNMQRLSSVEKEAVDQLTRHCPFTTASLMRWIYEHKTNLLILYLTLTFIFKNNQFVPQISLLILLQNRSIFYVAQFHRITYLTLKTAPFWSDNHIVRSQNTDKRQQTYNCLDCRLYQFAGSDRRCLPLQNASCRLSNSSMK